jgi:hypothetical protein
MPPQPCWSSGGSPSLSAISLPIATNATDLVHAILDPAPGRKIAKWRTPCWHGSEHGQCHAGNDQCFDIVAADQSRLAWAMRTWTSSALARACSASATASGLRLF